MYFNVGCGDACRRYEWLLSVQKESTTCAHACLFAVRTHLCTDLPDELQPLRGRHAGHLRHGSGHDVLACRLLSSRTRFA